MFIKFKNESTGLPVVVSIGSIDAYYAIDSKTTGVTVKGITFKVECSLLALEESIANEGYEVLYEI